MDSGFVSLTLSATLGKLLYFTSFRFLIYKMRMKKKKKSLIYRDILRFNLGNIKYSGWQILSAYEITISISFFMMLSTL